MADGLPPSSAIFRRAADTVAPARPCPGSFPVSIAVLARHAADPPLGCSSVIPPALRENEVHRATRSEASAFAYELVRRTSTSSGVDNFPELSCAYLTEYVQGIKKARLNPFTLGRHAKPTATVPSWNDNANPP
jgi:hypothetical protein